MGKRGKRNRRNLLTQGAQSSLLPTQLSTFALGNFKLPFFLVAALLFLCVTSRVQQNSVLLWSFLAAGGGLISWLVWLLFQSNRDGTPHAFNVVLRPQHYVQALVQISVFAYWGYFWRPVYDHTLLILAQILFAYTFDMLLAWSRRRDYVLGFGPFPIILSINLFLWFRDDWFYMQFLMIAVGFMGKEYLRWQREGRSVHIFNPSAFALG